MKKYLKEIELSSALLMIIGVVLYFTMGATLAAWTCAIGLILFFTSVIYKAFHWNEYEHDNKQYIAIMIVTIIILIVQMILR